MPHCLAQVVQLGCPQCGAQFNADLWRVVDCAERPDLAGRLRAGDLHRLACPQCGHVAEADAPLLVYRPVATVPGTAPAAPAGPEQAAPWLFFSPAQATSGEEDEEHAQELLGALAAALGEAWRDEWLEQVAWVPRQAIPALLGDNPGAALAELQRQMAAAQAAQAAQAADQPPVVRALFAFLDAPDEDAARRVFDEQRTLLQPYEAQRLLDELDKIEEPAIQEHISRRRALLRLLRGAAPAASNAPAGAAASAAPTAPTAHGTLPPAPNAAGAAFDNRGLQAGTLVQGQTANFQSAIAAAGGTATVTNITVHNAASLPKQWTRPTPPPVQDRVIARTAEMEAVIALIGQRERVAIRGRVAAAGVRGMAGVGKTTLARLVAHELDGRYPDGVLWTDVGPDVRTAADGLRLLNQWAGYCVGPLDAAELARLQFDPPAVRSLLAEHPRLLAVLDNVWQPAAVKPLLDALPAGAHLLVTTRLKSVLHDLAEGEYELGMLSPADGRGLAAARLHLPLVVEGAGWPAWLDALIEGVGRHPLALDVALGVLRREGDYASEWEASAGRILAAIRSGRGFTHLRLAEDDREHNVEAVLAYSYAALAEGSQARLRSLGAFALEAPFTTGLAAAAWACDREEARQQLRELADAALVTRVDEQAWQQHALLRGYAQALLHAAGEHEGAADRHARACLSAMRAADKAQRYSAMLPSMPQLRHAFAWAVDADLDLAQDLAANCANLMGAFGLGREQAQWCRQCLAASQARGGPAQVARAQLSLGNALRSLAALPGEDRRARLYEALAAYDQALRFYTADSAPLDYAGTQNNRAVLLSDLAALPGEDRRARMDAALAAYDEALRFRTPDSAPLDYSMTQNNRAALLSDLAALPGEDRRARLDAALAAYDEALRFYTAESAPLDYATTQNNRAVLLRDLAALPGEDRRARLDAALAAYDAALRFYTADSAPLDYAMTQNNRAVLLCALAALPGEDRRARLYEALAAYDQALRFYTADSAPLAYAMTQNNRAALLRGLAALPGEDRRARLDAALAAYDEALVYRTPDSAPLDYAGTQNNRAVLLRELAALPGEDRRARLYEALGIAWEAFNLFVVYQHDQYAQICARTLQGLRIACGADFAELWQALGVGEPPDWLLADDADLADEYNQLGCALEEAKDLPAALAAFARAVELQPERAMWRRNLASTLIDLGRLDEGEAALAAARTLEPDAPRLAELETELAAARQAAASRDEATGEEDEGANG